MCRPERNTLRRTRPPDLRRSEKRVRLARVLLMSLAIAPCPLLLLAFFAQDLLALVLDPLALVGLGRLERTDHRTELAELCLVGALYRDLRILLDADREALGNRQAHVVAQPDLQLQC